MRALTRRLQVRAENVLPAFEQEATATEPAGYILPIRRRQPHGILHWSSQWWFPSLERIVLSRGESPIGYRIPTEAVPWIAPDELEYELDEAPFADRVKLPPNQAPAAWGSSMNRARGRLCSPRAFLPPTAVREIIRPSLCTQVRDGRLHVSLPYAPILADYLDLVSAVEDTSRYLEMPVWIEGYAPSADPRLRSFSVTPDPGVLEVNLPPAGNWDELEQIYTLLDDEARRIRLISEKYSFGGNRDATGGGSHVVIGGATIADSPLLRRPDLLRNAGCVLAESPIAVAFVFRNVCGSYESVSAGG